MEEDPLSELRRSHEELLFALEEAWYRAEVGLDPAPELEAPFTRLRAATTKDSYLLAAQAAAQGFGLRLQAGIAGAIEASVTRREEAALFAREAAPYQGPGGIGLPLRELPALIADEPRRGHRAHLAEAYGAASESVAPLRADILARAREVAARLSGLSYPDHHARLHGLELPPLVAGAENFLRATADGYEELLGRAARRLAEPGTRAARELFAHDLDHLASLRSLGDLFPQGALALTVFPILSRFGLDPERPGIRLDLEPAPRKQPAPAIRAPRIPGGLLVSLRPSGRPTDYRALLHAFGVITQLAVVPRTAPHEDRRCRDPALAQAAGLLLAGFLEEPGFHRRILGAGRERAREAARDATLASLIAARAAAAGLPAELELARESASRSTAQVRATRLSEALRARHDERLQVATARPGLPVLQEVRARALASALRNALRERFDEDFWRNPRAGPFLTGLFARGTVADAQDVLGSSDAEAHGARVVAELRALS